MKPKIILCLALILSGVFPGFCNMAYCADRSPSIKITIDIPEIWIDGVKPYPRTLSNANPDDSFVVLIENISSKPLLLLRENGHLLDLWFEVVGEDGKTTVINQNNPVPTAVVNDDLRIEPGKTAGVVIRYVSENSGTWSYREWGKYYFPFPTSYYWENRKVTIRAVLKTAYPESEATKLGIWTGKAVSEPCEVILRKGAP